MRGGAMVAWQPHKLYVGGSSPLCATNGVVVYLLVLEALKELPNENTALRSLLY